MLNKIISFSSFLFLGCPAAQGAEIVSDFFKSNSETPFVRSHCFFGHSYTEPKIVEGLQRELLPWLKTCEKQILVAMGADKEALLRKKVKILVKLNSWKNSANLSILESSKSNLLDEKLLKVIVAASPFFQPPNDMPFRRNLIIEFGSGNVKVYISGSMCVSGARSTVSTEVP